MPESTNPLVPSVRWGYIERPQERVQQAQVLACYVCLAASLLDLDALPSVIVMRNGTSYCLEHARTV